MHKKLIKIAPVSAYFLLALLIAGCSPDVTVLPSPVTPALTSQPATLSPIPLPSQTPSPLPASPTPSASPTATATPTLTLSPTITPLPTRITDPYGVPMVLVPAGPFLMGSEVRAGNERPVHSVSLDDYYIDQYEVTFASFAQFLNEVGNQFEGNAHWIEANDPDLHVHEIDGVWQVDPGFENYPMNEVTWFGARAYCEWRGARLPTEAEWEKAARGTDGRTYPWGEEIDCTRANFAGCNYDMVPVDSYPESVSPYGAYNMAGNVMEWTADWYAPDYYAHSPSENPTGPESGDFKVFRGGSWINAPGNVRTTYRFPKLQVLTYKTTGLRCDR